MHGSGDRIQMRRHDVPILCREKDAGDMAALRVLLKLHPAIGRHERLKSLSLRERNQLVFRTPAQIRDGRYLVRT